MGRVAPGHASGYAHRRGAWRYGAAAVVTAAALACPAAAASAGTMEQVITGEHLRLVSVTSAAMSSLGPGESATWDVGVSVTTPGEAMVDVTLGVLSATPDTFEMDVARCDERWTAQGCSVGEVSLAEAPVVSGGTTSLGSIEAGSAPWYRVTVTMASSSEDASTTLRLTADGVGEELTADSGPGAPTPTSPLPSTGLAVLGQLALATAAVLTGLGVAALARRRRGAS